MLFSADVGEGKPVSSLCFKPGLCVFSPYFDGFLFPLVWRENWLLVSANGIILFVLSALLVFWVLFLAYSDYHIP